MTKLILLPCVALLAAASPASSNPPPVASQVAPADSLQSIVPPAGGGAAKSTAPEDKKICKQLPTTGSRLPNRACLTAREWKQVEDDMSR